MGLAVGACLKLHIIQSTKCKVKDYSHTHRHMRAGHPHGREQRHAHKYINKCKSNLTPSCRSCVVYNKCQGIYTGRRCRRPCMAKSMRIHSHTHRDSHVCMHVYPVPSNTLRVVQVMNLRVVRSLRMCGSVCAYIYTYIC